MKSSQYTRRRRRRKPPKDGQKGEQELNDKKFISTVLSQTERCQPLQKALPSRSGNIEGGENVTVVSSNTAARGYEFLEF